MSVKAASNIPKLLPNESRPSGGPLRNGKYEHFAHLVAKGESPAKAYVLCGYSENGALQSGNRLLRRPDVSARVKELKTAVSERLVEKIVADRAWVVAALVDNVRRAMQLEPVRDREGHPSGQYTYQGSVANKALELLGKELGMFQPKLEGTIGVQELMARLHAGRARVAEEKRRRDEADAHSANNRDAEKSMATDEQAADKIVPAATKNP